MRYNGPQCRLCRREGESICGKAKCALKRKPYAPGQHGQARKGKLSEFGRQLREKQKAKRIFNIAERQFAKYYQIAAKQKGVTGEQLLQLLERRLDNVVYRAGFATTRRQARQFVNHGLFTVNTKKVNIPSYQTRVGDIVTLREKYLKSPKFQDLANSKGVIPKWLKTDLKSAQTTVVSLPEKHELEPLINSAMIVEFYSK